MDVTTSNEVRMAEQIADRNDANILTRPAGIDLPETDLLPGEVAVLVINEGFPYANLIANLIGCLLLGAVTFALVRASSRTERRKLLAIGTGFCGSLTTFSGFAVQVVDLASWWPGKDLSAAAIYVVASVVGGACAFALGRTAMTRMATSQVRP